MLRPTGSIGVARNIRPRARSTRPISSMPKAAPIATAATCTAARCRCDWRARGAGQAGAGRTAAPLYGQRNRRWRGSAAGRARQFGRGCRLRAALSRDRSRRFRRGTRVASLRGCGPHRAGLRTYPSARSLVTARPARRITARSAVTLPRVRKMSGTVSTASSSGSSVDRHAHGQAHRPDRREKRDLRRQADRREAHRRRRSPRPRASIAGLRATPCRCGQIDGHRDVGGGARRAEQRDGERQDDAGRRRVRPQAPAPPRSSPAARPATIAC